MRIYPKLKATKFIALALVLSGCAVPDWLGAGESKPRLEGDRYEVMSILSTLKTDDSIQGESVDIPTEASGDLNNNGNYDLSGNLKSRRSVDIGSEANEYFNIISAPVSAENKIFVVDGANKVSAFDLNLKKIWETKVKSNDRSGQKLPGGIAYQSGRIFVTTGFGKVAGISAATGEILWEKDLSAPIRSAPAVDSTGDNGKVFVATADNKVFALSVEDGEIIWRHSGVEERTRKFASASPVVKNNVVAASYASGEIFGIQATQGREIWAELLSLGLSQTKAASGLNDISATPLVVDGIIYATSAGGKLVALNFNKGTRIWEQPIFGTATPWVAGRFIFILNDKEELIALNRFDGRVKWVKPLRNDEQKDDEPYIRWNGPIMAAGNLLVHDNSGNLVVVEPNEGKTVTRKNFPDDVYTSATVIDGKIYVVNNDARLIEVE